ncbi:MAP kinase-activated protein kinase 2 (Fragment) [Seminavis robusta]|uniref:MAP kinase-activated protein kinase 2 n=1 Tax=Seminavis robusta TaxID=568900 RepID=A0A9N8DIF8_9STRA
MAQPLTNTVELIKSSSSHKLEELSEENTENNLEHDDLSVSASILIESNVVDCQYWEGEDSFSFHTWYEMGQAIGEGSFGSVHKCFQRQGEKDSSSTMGSSFVVKAVPDELYNEKEIKIMDLLDDCPNIVQVVDLFHDNDASFIVMEEMEGGDLFEKVSQNGAYSEKKAKVLFKTLLETIQFCHSRGIAHCDIKPENILLQSQEDDTTIKVADFGLAKPFRYPNGRKVPMHAMQGTFEYAAPEVWEVFAPDEEDKGYGERCDIWSCGVVLYYLLSGCLPFVGKDARDTIDQVSLGRFKFPRRQWNKVSYHAKFLIAQLLQVDPDDRCTLKEALSSPWFDGIEEQATREF